MFKAQRRRDTLSVSRKESVYTFYQNNKLSLLYGKNNVSVKGLENEEVIKGGNHGLHLFKNIHYQD